MNLRCAEAEFCHLEPYVEGWPLVPLKRSLRVASRGRGEGVSAMARTMVAGVPRGFREQRTPVGEVTLNYVEGPRNGEPLLLIPGQMESWQGYKRVLPALSERYHVFVPDLRGHGRSSRTPGHYSYNICGTDLRTFLDQVVGRPAHVSGLSSGGVLAVWLGAYAPDRVLSVVAEDPPIFASVWPRIRDEKFLCLGFETAARYLGAPQGRDLRGYFAHAGLPFEGETELRLIPKPILAVMFGIISANRTLSPKAPYDIPFLPFNLRAGLKFLSEYDPDFSRATADGDLSEDFSPTDALRKVCCPMLLMWSGGTRVEGWGLLGAMDAADVHRVQDLVDDLRVVTIECRHEIHMLKPDDYLTELTTFIG